VRLDSADRGHGYDRAMGRSDAAATSDWLFRFSSALVGDDASACLEAALARLAEIGVVARAGASAGAALGDSPWLTLGAGPDAVILDAVGEAPNAATTALIGNLLRLALARRDEKNEHKRTRERLEMLSAASFEGLLIHIDGVVIDANQIVAEMVGYEHSEILGPATFQRCVAEEDKAFLRERIASREEGAYVITAVRKDGSRFRAELRSKQGHLGERPVRVAAVRDITEHERMSAAVRESEARMRELVAATFDFMVLSRGTTIVDVGGATEEMLGWTHPQLVGRALVDLMAPSERALAERMISGACTGAHESAVMSAAGEPVPVLIVVAASTLHGEPVRIVGARDLRPTRRLETERRRLEAQVAQSQRLESLGVLAGGIAHDFNNLLVGVLGSAEYLLTRLRDPRDLEAAGTIRMAGLRAADLTRQMLAYAGKNAFAQRERVDLSGLCHELRALLEAMLSKKARVKLDVEPHCDVEGERATLSQVLMNLLTNASDALGDRPGVIEVRTRRVREPDEAWSEALGAAITPGDWILLEVRDDGEGMDETTRRRIFEPFFTTKPRGHGLGLAACLGIVRSHGGAIRVESEPGKGTCFRVLLPASARSQGHAAKEPRKLAESAPCTVLVIDDEPLVRSHLRRVLEDRGYTVEEARDGKTALATYDRVAPDVIVIDFSMPDLDGTEVIARLRRSGSKVPIILSSGYLELAGERNLPADAVQATLQKPYGVADLLGAIRRVLG
jgi:two-component system cell cycle sensor histidine kinase/response regulator CckA